jgi:hypothetical protein
MAKTEVRDVKPKVPPPKLPQVLSTHQSLASYRRNTKVDEFDNLYSLAALEHWAEESQDKLLEKLFGLLTGLDLRPTQKEVYCNNWYYLQQPGASGSSSNQFG